MSDLSECNVMIVDDTETNIDILLNTLGDDYNVRVAMDGESALQDISESHPDIVLLDVMMPGIDGYEVCRCLKKDPLTKDIPVIFLTALAEKEDEAKGLSLGAVDYITKPFNPDLVKARVRNHLELKHHKDHLEELVESRTKQLEITQEVTIECMSVLTECRDPETGGHIQRTKQYVKVLAEQLSENPKFKKFLDKNIIELLYKSAPLHDIGKVGVSDHILFKTGTLTEDEFSEIKKHSEMGMTAIMSAEKKLGDNSFLHHAGQIAGTHHERWDGQGYPNGLKGDSIPLSGRIMSVADVYDALISKRIYKDPFTHEMAVDVILKSSGSQFDPDIVDAFMEINDKFRQVAIENIDSEKEQKL